jgi:sporulation protein YlmC with PRC-barrel domain
MLVPFGTHVLDRDGKSVGTVSRLVLHPDSRQVVAIVVQQGVIDRREVVVPLGKVARFSEEVRLDVRASELAGFGLYGAPSLRPMPDHWPMPTGFDERSFFLVAGDGWTAATLPFQLTSSAVSGTPAFIPDPEAPERRAEPAIAEATTVYDGAGQDLGDVEGVELDQATGRITRVIVRRGRLFGRETTVPAGLIASVAADRITLSVSADEAKKLERGRLGELGRAPAA